MELSDDEVRCPRCGEIKSKVADRFAVVQLTNSKGDEKHEVWCQGCASKSAEEAATVRVN